jgi:hypothetical protein
VPLCIRFAAYGCNFITCVFHCPNRTSGSGEYAGVAYDPPYSRCESQSSRTQQHASIGCPIIEQPYSRRPSLMIDEPCRSSPNHLPEILRGARKKSAYMSSHSYSGGRVDQIWFLSHMLAKVCLLCRWSIHLQCWPSKLKFDSY